MSEKYVFVIGSGAWGTALGVAAERAGNRVTLWDNNPVAVEAINNDHVNTPYLPGIPLNGNIGATTDLFEAKQADIILLVVPMTYLDITCMTLVKIGVPTTTPIVVACKGIDQQNLLLPGEIVAAALPKHTVAVLSGPNFADEVAKGMPSATTIACTNEEVAKMLVDTLGTPTFRTYYSTDVMGAQVAGAAKNVLAIACGMAAGRGYGENTRAALITRGTAEIKRLCEAKGGRSETMLGLCGVGDIMLTCSSTKSRNMSLGYQLGQGKSLKEVLGQGKTVEGYFTAKSIHTLAKKLEIHMPIAEAVYRILYESLPVDEAIKNLMNQPFSAE